MPGSSPAPGPLLSGGGGLPLPLPRPRLTRAHRTLTREEEQDNGHVASSDRSCAHHREQTSPAGTAAPARSGRWHLPPSAESSWPPVPLAPSAPGIGGLFRHSLTFRQCSSSWSVLGSCRGGQDHSCEGAVRRQQCGPRPPPHGTEDPAGPPGTAARHGCGAAAALTPRPETEALRARGRTQRRLLNA